MKNSNASRPSSYFELISASRFVPTSYVGGGWNPAEQHIAPALGLLAHLVETHRDGRRQDGLQIGRASYDIYGVLPMEACDVEIEVIRPGKTIELVEARLLHAGRVGLTLRAWLMATMDTQAVAGDPYARLPAPDALPSWDMTGVWPGGFVRSVQLRRDESTPGAATYWVNTDVSLLAGAEASPTARLLGLLDTANGVTPRAHPKDVAFPNIDLTAHLLRQPVGDWVGFDTKVGFGPTGLGVTHSIVHDVQGPVAVLSQSLTVRPRIA
ncbi:thioesterase family protein [Achromobacter aloeverae]|uniref:Thioesterase n=1 Tax=Achromobacter aloeverae TaxID=1750518 RepID=A0A4Q1HMA9_9BURK|nr:thioesterase family protein [Achromobacter aloeverae]RXN91416.1 thioesterase [Achromobacter aloeverae]